MLKAAWPALGSPLLQRITADMRRWSILLTCALPAEVEADLGSALDVRRLPDAATLPLADLAAAAEGADALLVLATMRVDAGLIAALPASVKAIATYSVGHNHIDLEAARRRDIAVLYTPDVLTDSVAEVAMLLLLGAVRRATESIDLVRSGRWPGWKPTQLNGVELTGKSLGIFGMGRIGRGIAQRARAFGMHIQYHNRRRLQPELEAGALYHANAEMLLDVDALVLASPLNDATHGFLNAARIARLKQSAVVVNVGRGELIVDDALIRALQEQRIMAAGLDVFSNEPHFDRRYLALPNVFMLPHIGSSTLETRRRMGRCLIDGLVALANGEEPDNRITTWHG